jgi:hypothetical protein
VGPEVLMARRRCCWWRQGTLAVGYLVAAAGAVCWVPAPVQWLAPQVAPPGPPSPLCAALPMRCTAFQVPGPRSLPGPAGASVRPAAKQDGACRQTNLPLTGCVSDSSSRDFRFLRRRVWVVAPCGLVEFYRRFGGTYCLHHQDDEWPDDGGSKHLRNHRSTSSKVHGATCRKSVVFLLSGFPKKILDTEV